LRVLVQDVEEHTRRFRPVDLGPPVIGPADHARTQPAAAFVYLRKQLQCFVVRQHADTPRVDDRASELRMRSIDRAPELPCREAVAEPAVDRTLRRCERGSDLAPLDGIDPQRLEHPSENSAPSMTWLDRDRGDGGDRDEGATRHGELERIGPTAPRHLATIEGASSALELRAHP